MTSNTVIFGGDGYIGWPLAIHLGARRDDRIIIVDNLCTRKLVKSVKSDTLVPIRSMKERLSAYTKETGKRNITFVEADARDPKAVDRIIEKYKPENIVHLAQQRSAPFSMVDQEHVLYTELNNIATNLNVLFSMVRHVPDAHLLKMGSMGEYGTPGIEITEGDIELERNGKKARLMFPRMGGSWYHLSKIFDTYNVAMANRVYDITATDVMQGVVFGTRVDEITNDALATRFDFDSIWGTVINKYVVQSVLLNKLLIYGKGRQTRGFLSLYDSVNCLTLLLDNPPEKGKYRVVNQIDEIYDTLQLAEKVQKIGREYGIDAGMEYVENPRVEKEEHIYEVEHKILPSLGFRREKSMDEVIHEIFDAVIQNKKRASAMKKLIYPTVYWKTATELNMKDFAMPKSIMDYRKPK
ncbi:MAG: NAD-dependent epimerase/dehydratase family protein [Thermoplasmata archaeon]|nr:NAD-dependent epimerase/dehydratase family protein [Candidatus Sysuiplasma jiujiangense]MBX8639345.1 NAD-dependent epimerase/dehydratase family protein [Candidatus Sysuiplasma jiujiangense]MBX8641314.1 NAD-dependent epimerase/dehydratase family protein [Candidatus Sysuiplasma jiujiangense]